MRWVAESKWAKGAVGITKSTLFIDRAPKAQIVKRLDICRACDEVTRSRKPKFAESKGLTNLSRCRICKCFVVAKTKIASEVCPLSKWSSF
jgi:hypothetical protein